MTARISELWRFPLKGARGEQLEALDVNPIVGVVNDRRIAVRHRPGDVTERTTDFRKTDYVVGMNTAAMAFQRPEFIPESDYELDPAFLEKLHSLRPGEKLSVHDTRGEYHLADTAGAQVSFLNLATIEAFEEFVVYRINPTRFRMNVWLKGLPAFAEYAWVDQYPGTREIMVGAVRMRVDDASERCKATHANPATGEYDLPMVSLLKGFMGARGYKSPHRGVEQVMGIYGVVLNPGTLRIGQKVTLL